MSEHILSESLEHERFVDGLRRANEELVEVLTQARAWINDECERRGKEDGEYDSPASAMVTAIDVVFAKVKGAAS